MVIKWTSNQNAWKRYLPASKLRSDLMCSTMLECSTMLQLIEDTRQFLNCLTSKRIVCHDAKIDADWFLHSTKLVVYIILLHNIYYIARRYNIYRYMIYILYPYHFTDTKVSTSTRRSVKTVKYIKLKLYWLGQMP